MLAKVEAGPDEEVIRKVRKIAGVKQATPTYGLYDLHVEVSFDTMEELDKFIFDGIRRAYRNKRLDLDSFQSDIDA